MTAAPAHAPKTLRPMSWANPAPVEAALLPTYELPARPRFRLLVAVRHVGILNEGFEVADQNRLTADTFDYKINEWDEAALEEALLIAEKIGECEIVAVTIGNESAEASLRKALAMGADRGVRIWHDSLEDADPITIARGLAGVARLEQPDLFFCGVQSADLGHGATGTALAAIMRVPHSAAVVKCGWDGTKKILITRELEGGTLHSFELPVPAVLTIQTGANQPRYATMRMIKQAKKKPISVVDGATLDDGSGGFVVDRMYKPRSEKAAMLDGGAGDVAAFIIERIREAGGA